MDARTLFRLRDDFKNPDGDRRTTTDANRLPVVPKGTWFIRHDDDGHWTVRGYPYPGVRRRLIDAIMPQLEEVPVMTVDQAGILYNCDRGDCFRLVKSLVESKRLTLQEMLDFLALG
jgi:hypothetical protein